MKLSSASIALSILSLAACAPLEKRQNPEYASLKDETNLMPFYPYVVHEPVNWTDSSPPPAILFLGGTGSRGNDTSMFNEWSTWNGPGKRLKEYLAGNITDASKLIGEQVLLITPIAPDETLLEWRTEHIIPLVEDARSKYAFDDNRLYLAGFSMGARESWRLLKQNNTYWAGAVICAGEPEDEVGIEAVINIPIRQCVCPGIGARFVTDLSRSYQGEEDYVSVAARAYKNQEAIQAAGGNSTEMILVPGISHNSMADAPWQLDMFQWLLSQNKLNWTVSSTPGSSVISALEPAPTSPPSVAADQSSGSQSLMLSTMSIFRF